MIGRLNRDQSQLFYFVLPRGGGAGRSLAREIAALLKRSCVHAELAPYCAPIDAAFVIWMLLVGYVVTIRSEQLLCRVAQGEPHHCCVDQRLVSTPIGITTP